MAQRRSSRSLAEWVIFGVACVVLVVVVGLMVKESFGSFDPPAPVAEVTGNVRSEGGHYFVDVDVTNRGDQTAAQVQVTAELTVDGETTTGDQVLDFLGGDEVAHVSFGFETDPAAGDLTVRVTGYSEP